MSEQTQLLCVSTPNSGIQWLCSLIAETAPKLHYCEGGFFSPLVNRKYELQLGREFGCELASYVDHIAAPPDEEALEQIYRATWRIEDRYRFDAEVWSPTKLGWFQRHFHVFALFAGFDEVFPTMHARVWPLVQYEAMYEAAVRAGGIDLAVGFVPVLERCRLAYLWACGQILEAGVPVVNYAKLLHGDQAEILAELANAGLDAFANLAVLTEKILASRGERR